MTNFFELLQQKLATQAQPETPVEETKEAADTPPSFEEHKFKKKQKDDDDASDEHEECEDESSEKKARDEFAAFSAEALRLTEKTAALIHEAGGAAAEQLFRNMVSSSINFKLAGYHDETLSDPRKLVRNAHEMMKSAARLLEIPLA